MDGAGGYYVEISLDGLLLAAGLYAPQSDQVERMRAAVADGRRAAARCERAWRRRRAGGLALGEPDLKRVAARLSTPSIRGRTCCATGGWSSTSACPSRSG